MEAGQAEAKRFRNKLEIEQLVAEFEKSGLSRKAFSGEHGISVHTLDAYRSGYIKDGKPETIPIDCCPSRSGSRCGRAAVN